MLHLPINKTALNLKSLPLQRTGAETHRIQTYPVFVKSKALHIPAPSLYSWIKKNSSPSVCRAVWASIQYPTTSCVSVHTCSNTHAPLFPWREWGGKTAERLPLKETVEPSPCWISRGGKIMCVRKNLPLYEERGGERKRACACMNGCVCRHVSLKGGVPRWDRGQLPPPQNHLCASDSTESEGLILFLAQRRVCSGFLYLYFFNHQCWIVLNTLLCNCPTTTAMAL